jgi:hypothetical protein
MWLDRRRWFKDTSEANLSYTVSSQSGEPLDETRNGPWSSMFPALWAMLTSRDLTCASEESMCAGDDFSESDLGRANGPIRDNCNFFRPTLEAMKQVD